MCYIDIKLYKNVYKSNKNQEELLFDCPFLSDDVQLTLSVTCFFFSVLLTAFVRKLISLETVPELASFQAVTELRNLLKFVFRENEDL